MLLIIARVIGTATISSLFPVKFNGSALINGGRVIGAFISPGDSSLSSAVPPSRIRFTFVILHLRAFTVDSLNPRCICSTYITNARQLFMLDLSSSYTFRFTSCYQEERNIICTISFSRISAFEGSSSRVPRRPFKSDTHDRENIQIRGGVGVKTA